MLMYVTLGLPLFLNPDNTFGVFMTQEESSWFGEFTQTVLSTKRKACRVVLYLRVKTLQLCSFVFVR
jgi:hypothetical protein